MAFQKARVDLLYDDSRELVLLASYAEHLDDWERAARWYQQAWCADADSEFLEGKVTFYQQIQILPEELRCYADPRFYDAVSP